MRGIGHNNGPALDGGKRWRAHCWTKARSELLPTLPIEILRNRVRRAKELGLPYKTYASVRASTGRDVVAFLFSSNALRVIRPNDVVPEDRADQLLKLKDCTFACLVQPPQAVDAFVAQVADGRQINISSAGRAPDPHGQWSAIRDAVQAPLISAKLPLDGVLAIGDTVMEREWSEAGKLAGYLSADRYFDLS